MPTKLNAGGFLVHPGDYRKLFSYKKTVILYDMTVHYISRFLTPSDRTYDQMKQELQDLLHREVDLVESDELLPFAQESANRDKYLIYERA